MITFCKQKEIFIGNSLNRFNEIRGILSENKIEYTHKIIDKNNSPLLGEGRRSRGTLIKNIKYQKIYYIYLHKKDYHRACYLLKNIGY